MEILRVLILVNCLELRLTKDFTGNDIRKCNLYKDFAGINFAFAIRKIFSTTLVYVFKNDLSNNYYFFSSTNDKIIDSLERLN